MLTAYALLFESFDFSPMQPGLPKLELVDLPGLRAPHMKDGVAIQALVDKYVKDPKNM